MNITYLLFNLKQHEVPKKNLPAEITKTVSYNNLIQHSKIKTNNTSEAQNFSTSHNSVVAKFRTTYLLSRLPLKHKRFNKNTRKLPNEVNKQQFKYFKVLLYCVKLWFLSTWNVCIGQSMRNFSNLCFQWFRPINNIPHLFKCLEEGGGLTKPNNTTLLLNFKSSYLVLLNTK